MRYLINDKWKFREFSKETPFEEVYTALQENAETFKPIDIPHDWMIYDTNNLYRSSVGVYVRSIELDGSHHNAVYFEGVYMRTSIYLNGEKIYFRPYGYTSFEVDLTPYQRDGENELLVYVDYRYPNTRWYSGAGIFRDVWLNSTEHVRLVTDGIYFNAVYVGVDREASDDMSGTMPEALEDLAVDAIKMDRFLVTVDTEVIATKWKTEYIGSRVRVRHRLISQEGKAVAETCACQNVYGEPSVNTQSFEVENVTRWDIDNPYLYTLTTELYVEERKQAETDGNKEGDRHKSSDETTWEYSCRLADSFEQKVGFRTIRFTPDAGFFLNGRHVKLHGVCQHHDLGALGAAFNKKAARRQIEKLKTLGVNSIRTSHNPPAVQLMELADEMGILIDSEAFDMWEESKTENDYGVFFHDWCERDVESWVRRDRNHPSVIMWSCGNEIPDTNHLSAVHIAKRLVDAVRRCDPRHNAYTTIGSNMVAWENAQKSQELFEISGYNYLESVYDEHREKFPHWCIYGSETGSTVQSRGIYHFPKSNRMLTYEDMQCSCLDNCSTNWGAKSVHRFITADRDRDYCAGQYIWTGWDYIGEPTPYFSKNSFFGHIDTAGFFKDTAYIIKAGWVSVTKEPFVHIAPYWDFNEGQIIDVELYSNAPKVALYFDNELVGEKVLDQWHDEVYSASFRLPYREGVLLAKAYDSDGVVVAQDETGSFGDPAAIVLKTEYETIAADGEDMQFVEISVVDQAGNEVRNARNRITISVSGPGRLVGMDNGDSTDYDQYKCNSRKLFSGKLIAMIAATREAGEIKVTAHSEGLPEHTITFMAVEGKARDGISCGYDIMSAVADELTQNDITQKTHGEDRQHDIMCAAVDESVQTDVTQNIMCIPVSCNAYIAEVPVRKLALVSDRSDKELTPDMPEVRVTAGIRPDNATYRDVHFKAVTSDGIESRAVTIEADGCTALIKAQHDGAFRLVASADNGKEHPEILSELEFAVSGFGEATLDPYDFVYGCQFDKSDQNAELSFRGSVKTEDNIVISFADVDFGEYGSDELHLSLYSFRNEEHVEIWDEEPDVSELLFAGQYSVEPEYNVLQADTFKLKKRLTGIRGITFRFEHGFVFGGFSMTRQEKAYGRLKATEHGMITGDTYEEKTDGIYEIGNNVDIEFPDMNFRDGVSALTITGQARTANPIHVRFFMGDEVVKQVFEFPVTGQIETVTLPIRGFEGSGKVNFIFLPGSDFDFIDFQFKRADN